VHDADSRGNDAEGFEGLLAPLEEFVTFPIAEKLDGEVAIQSALGTGEIDLHGVVNDQINRHERFHHGRIHSGDPGGVAHGSEVDDERHAGEVLEDDPGHGERDFVAPGVLGIPIRQIADVLFGNLVSVAIAKDGLQDDADRDRQPVKTGSDPLFLKGGERVIVALTAGAGGETAQGIHASRTDRRYGRKFNLENAGVRGRGRFAG